MSQVLPTESSKGTPSIFLRADNVKSGEMAHSSTTYTTNASDAVKVLH